MLFILSENPLDSIPDELRRLGLETMDEWKIFRNAISYGSVEFASCYLDRYKGKVPDDVLLKLDRILRTWWKNTDPVRVSYKSIKHEDFDFPIFHH